MYNVLLALCLISTTLLTATPVTATCPTVTGTYTSYNLAPLQQLELQTIANNVTYYISICSDSKQCPGNRGCVVSESGEKKLLGNTVSAEGAADYLNVTISGGDVTTYITLLCANSIGRPEVQYAGDKELAIMWSSVAGCKDTTQSPDLLPCYGYTADKQLYDISHLVGTNYHIPISSDSGTNTLYFSLCGAVSGSGGCEGGAACLHTATDTYNIGNVHSPGLRVDESGITLDYVNNNSSSAGCPQIVTTVRMECAQHQESLPFLLHGKEQCIYNIFWRTSHACQVQAVHDVGCKIQTQAGHFDLSPLTKQDYWLEANEHSYDLAVCKNTEISCNQTLSSGCITNKLTNKTWSMGTYHEGNLVWDDTGLTITYNGGTSCSTGMVRSTKILFVCDKTVSTGAPELTGDQYCFYSFIWRTKYACPGDEEVRTCAKYGTGGELYDLSLLAHTSWAPLDLSSSSSSSSPNLLLSVCGESVCRDGSLCRKLDNGTYEPVAGLTNHFKVNQDKSLKLVFEGVGVCVSQQTSLTLEMTCKQGSLTTAPVLLSSSPCNYLISWETGAACPAHTVLGSECRVQDDITGLTFDINSLASQPYSISVVGDETHTLSVQLCSSLQNSPCGQGVSVCRSDGVNLGNSHSSLAYKSQSLAMAYAGDTCEQGEEDQKYKTLVEFVCNVNKAERRAHQMLPCVYYISWTDPAVCPMFPMECAVVNNTHSFDLSPLYDLGNLQWAGMLNNTQTTLYVRVCGQVQPAASCSHTAGVCAVFEKEGGSSVSYNLGKSGSVLSITNDVISEQYDNGDRVCTDSTLQAHTKVEYKCATDKQTRILSAMFNEETCMYIIVVSSPYGCTEQTIVSHNCSVYDPLTGHMADFSFLKDDYEFENSNSRFKLHLCGALSSPCGSDKLSAACEIVNGNQMSLGDSSTTALSLIDGVYTLKYTNGEKCSAGRDQIRYKETLVTLRCNKNVKAGVPKYLNKDGESCVYNFEMELAAACPPQQLTCNAISKDLQEYDLSLLKRSKPWTVHGAGNELYYLNVCAGVPQCGEDVGICRVSGTQTTVYGRTGGEPRVREDGVVQLDYYHGDVCNTDTQTLWTTTLLFTCHKQTESMPSVTVNEGTCHVTVEWSTLHACPAVYNTGTNCTVQNQVTGVTYDLWKLANTDFSVRVKQWVYKYSFCSALSTPCNGQSNSATCQVEGATEKNNGNVNTTVVYTNGVIVLKYIGGDTCSRGDVRRTTINLVCDHALQDDQLQFDTVNETAHCVYQAFAYSGLPCDKEVLSSCEVAGYDITALSLTRGNYYAQSGDFIYVINVCRGTNVPSPCSSGTAVCMMRGATGISVGTVSSAELVYEDENKELELKMEGADICPATGKPYQSYIKFLCAADDTIGTPQYLSNYSCSYQFLWRTRYACVNEIQPDSCKIIDTASGRAVYDLTSLSGAVWETTDDKKGRYAVSVCGALPDTQCKGNTAVCRTDTDTGAGQSLGVLAQDTKLTSSGEEGPVTLTYKNGDVCTKTDGTTEPYRTVIEFVCPGVGQPGLTLTSRDGCVTRFTLSTPLVCKTDKLSCEVVKDGHVINLSPLFNTFEKYRVLNKILLDGTVYLSVCRSLPAELQCKPESAACLSNFSDNTQVDLGHITTPLHVTTEGDIELLYEGGDVCTLSDGTTSRLQTQILFKCDTDAIVNIPKLVDRSSCLYNIEFNTELACTPDIAPVHSCQVTDNETGYVYDLTRLQRNYFPYQTETEGGEKYTMNVCGVVGACKDNTSAVCLTENDNKVSLGRAEQITTRLLPGQEGEVEITYRGGDKCVQSDKERSSVIVVMCCTEEEEGNPLNMQYSDGCTYQFTLCSNKVCQFTPQECTFKLGANLYDFSALARRYDNWLVKRDEITYYINVCRGVNAKQLPARGCTENSVVCSSEKAIGETFSLGLLTTRVQRQHYDKIKLQYSSGSTEICTDRAARTEIVFSCGPSLGKPLFVGSRDCMYNFKWETYVACNATARPVTSNTCKYDHPLTHATVDLSKVTSTYFRVETSRGPIYFTACDKSLPKELDKSKECGKSDVCFHDNTNGHVLNFNVKSKELFITEDTVEAVLQSDVKCEDSESKNWAAVVEYTCSQNKSTAAYFRAISHCHILLGVHTPLVCPGYQPERHHLLLVMLLLACAVFAGLLIVYMCIKKSRRDKFLRKLRGLIPVRGARTRTMAYKRLGRIDKDITELLSDSDEEIIEM